MMNSDEKVTPNAAQRVVEFLEDVSQIARLQRMLLAADLRDLRRNVLCVVALVVAALWLVTACLAVLLVGLGLLVADLAGVSPGWGLMGVGLGACGVAAAMILWARHMVIKRRAILDPTRCELRQNAVAVRDAIATACRLHRKHSPAPTSP